MKFLLASNSPRRAELLRNAGFEFEVISNGAQEGPPGSDEPPEDYARRLARGKALGAAANAPPGSVVLGADTIVTLNGSILGKPLGPFDAARMIRMLSGMTHQVITAICLVKAPDQIAALKHETTFVTFREISVDEIHDYVGRKEPYDKAGAYAIQGLASRFATRISGCYFNVVGLPIALLDEVLRGIEAASAKSKAGSPTPPQAAPSPVKG